jgi:hypothetical protein
MKTSFYGFLKNRISMVLALAFSLVMVFPVVGSIKPAVAAEISSAVLNDGDTGDLGSLNISMEDDGEGGASVSVTGLDNGDTSSTWTTIFKKYKVVILGFSGIATLTFVLLFIKNFISLGANADNPTGRRAAITGCLWTGIATALCGSIMLVVGLFWNGLKD